MAKNKKKDQHAEILEDPNALIEKANDFFDNKRNRAIVFSIIGVLLLVVIAISGYNYYITEQDKIAQEELFQAQFYFESDSMALALNGDGNSYGFLEIIDEFPGTEAANLSSFYAGVCYLKMGDFEGSVRHLKDFSSSDYLIQARAYSLIGDAYIELDDFENAIKYYQKASDYKPNEFYTPVYLIKLAIAQENAGNLKMAVDTYQTIIDDYVTSNEIHYAKKHKARLEAKMAEL